MNHEEDEYDEEWISLFDGPVRAYKVDQVFTLWLTCSDYAAKTPFCALPTYSMLPKVWKCTESVWFVDG